MCVDQKLAVRLAFCGRDCLKAKWKEHKAWHTALAEQEQHVKDSELNTKTHFSKHKSVPMAAKKSSQ